jgi:hypothetical protein
MVGCCEHNDESPGPIKGRQFLNYLNEQQTRKTGLCSMAMMLQLISIIGSVDTKV